MATKSELWQIRLVFYGLPTATLLTAAFFLAIADVSPILPAVGCVVILAATVMYLNFIRSATKEADPRDLPTKAQWLVFLAFSVLLTFPILLIKFVPSMFFSKVGILTFVAMIPLSLTALNKSTREKQEQANSSE